MIDKNILLKVFLYKYRASENVHTFEPSRNVFREMNECPDNNWHAPRDLICIAWQGLSDGSGTAYMPSWKQATPIRRDCPQQPHTTFPFVRDEHGRNPYGPGKI